MIRIIIFRIITKKLKKFVVIYNWKLLEAEITKNIIILELEGGEVCVGAAARLQGLALPVLRGEGGEVVHLLLWEGQQV